MDRLASEALELALAICRPGEGLAGALISLRGIIAAQVVAHRFSVGQAADLSNRAHDRLQLYFSTLAPSDGA